MLPIDLQILKYFFFEKPLYHFKIQPHLSSDCYRDLTAKLAEYQPVNHLAADNLQEATFTVFDLETTGLIPEVGHEIISIGAIQIKGFSYCHTKKFYRVIKPIRPIPKRVTELTGLDLDTIRHGHNFMEVFSDFFEYCKDTILVAHPAKFDVRFLETMLKRWKLPAFHPFVLDSQEIAKWLIPEKNSQLDPLIRYYKIPYLDRHHALNDAIMTAELFQYLLRDVSKTKNYSLEELQAELDEQKKDRIHRPVINKEWS